MVQLLFVILFIFATAAPPLFAADTQLSQEAEEELFTQTTYLQKEALRISLEEEAEPEIIVEEKKEFPIEKVGPTFLIKKINLEGNKVIKTSDLAKYTQSFENTQTTFGGLKGLSQLITNHYRSMGYTTSRAYIPPQKIQDHTITIRVIEGKIGKIYIEGNKYFNTRSYENAFQPLKEKIFRYQDLEASLFFLNRMPDRKAKAYLIAGKEPTTSDIILKVEETKPFHVLYGFNNRGGKLTHRFRHNLRITHNSFTGNGDTLDLNGVVSAEEGTVRTGSVLYSYPLADRGTTLGFGASYATSMLAKHLKSLEAKGKSWSVSPSITQTFIQQPRFTLDGSASFQITESKSLINDFKTTYDRVRVLVLGPRMNFQDPSGRTILGGNVHIGIPNFLGGLSEVDRLASRVNAGSKFFYYTANVARLQRINESSFLVVKGGVQWTKDNLLSSEQFRLGGVNTVRGYPEGDAAGDYGYNVGTELSVPIFFLPKQYNIPFSKTKWQDGIRIVTFVEGGKVFKRQREALTDVRSEYLLGTGVGLRVNIDKSLSVSIDWGFPLGDPNSDKDRQQFHFSFQYGF